MSSSSNENTFSSMPATYDYSIIGSELQILQISLQPGQHVSAEPGAMCYMSDGIQCETSTGGGLWSGAQRLLVGESLFLNVFTNTSNTRNFIGFASNHAGKIIHLNMDEMGTMLCQSTAFLAAAPSVTVSSQMTQKWGAGFFGGEGLFLQKLTGRGSAFIHASGTIVEMSLNSGQKLKIDSGCLVAFQQSVDYSIEYVGSVKAALFAGEGLFYATVTGPGKVYIQSLPVERLASTLMSAARGQHAGSSTSSIGGLAFFAFIFVFIVGIIFMISISRYFPNFDMDFY